MAKPAIESVEKGEIKFVPERFTKNSMNWMKNTRDWCISRQLWWGHQSPAWYCDNCGETVVAKSAPCACPKCGSAKLTQDTDHARDRAIMIQFQEVLYIPVYKASFL